MRAKVGIIAEDNSDVETLKIFIRRINPLRFQIKGHSTKGCGRLKKKCTGIVCHLVRKGITKIIICHDLDSDDPDKLASLKKALREKVKASMVPNNNRVICIVIPVQELEAWFLADVSIINKRFIGAKLKEIPNPEKIPSPKEYIEKVSRDDRWKPRYINTNDNPKLAEVIDIDKVRTKCPAFSPFYDFISLLRTCAKVG